MTAADRTGAPTLWTAAARAAEAWPWWALAAVPALLLCASALAVGFRLPYWHHADQDLVLVYHGLLLNQGLPQEYFDHPGYLYFLVIEAWFRLLHLLGLLPEPTLEALPPLADAAAHGAAWQRLVEAGRALSIALCAGLTVAVTVLVRALTGDRLSGLAGGLAFAFAVGAMTQARQMRTDLLSGGLAALALLLVLVAVRRRPDGGALALLAGAGLCAALAMATKVQAIFLLMAIPVLAVAFGRRPDHAGRDAGGGWGRAALLALAAGAALVPAAEILRMGMASWDRALYPYTPVGGGLSGVYQGVVAGWIALGVLVHAAVWRVRPAVAVQGLAAVVFGLSVGILSLAIRWHEQNAIAVANPVEHMFVFSTWRHAGALQGEQQVLSGSLFGLLLDGLWRTFAIRTVVLHPDRLPQTLLVEWFAIAGAVVAWRRGEGLLALRVGLLLSAAWGLETLFSLRGFQRAYHIYTDPLVVLAGALVFARFRSAPALRARRWWLAGGLGLYLALAHVWPVIDARKNRDAVTHCAWIPDYMARVEGFAFCGPFPPRGG